MAVSTNSDFVDFIIPLRERMNFYDKTRSPTDQEKNDAADPARSLPQGFIDSMIIREAVYVQEQGVPLENELDDEDALAFHWVAYASVPDKVRSDPSSPEMSPQGGRKDSGRRISTSTKMPIGTIRATPVPYPQQHPHPNGKYETAVHKNNEAYVRIGRLSVVKEFRKAGIAKLLVDTALGFISAHPYETFAYYDQAATSQAGSGAQSVDFRGLVLVHSQTGVQKVWRKYGFETDESMGEWDEEGILHVGMWKRLDLSNASKKNKIWLPGGPS
ncbi:uncharacterized protein LTR77_008163 [Saxophila tyrrhenica]|uniref:Glucosamine-phosphate N-acetyltransferase n=1 Tax=Saxophila tyrrhenica TaxID=1690608 RepID=A0AAV9P204_9PEZI|nr:hypothetical protein LTR77_008163 [Saxophila tyrrhenica]